MQIELTQKSVGKVRLPHKIRLSARRGRQIRLRRTEKKALRGCSPANLPFTEALTEISNGADKPRVDRLRHCSTRVGKRQPYEGTTSWDRGSGIGDRGWGIGDSMQRCGPSPIPHPRSPCLAMR